MSSRGSWWRHLRQRSLTTGHSLVNRCYHSHRCLITWNSLAGPPAPDRVGDIVFRLATSSDLNHLDHLAPYGRGATDRLYVERDKDLLFVACHDDRIVALRRYGRVIRHQLVSRILTLGTGQLWSADIFCLPEYRNRGIPRHLGHFAERLLAGRGYTELFGVVAVTNTPSLRTVLAKGARPIYYVSYFRVLSYERLRVSKDIPSKFVDDVMPK
jgi:GNAT superfamily N-acetyltransferase